jgi:ATP-dependent DNA ligase
MNPAYRPMLATLVDEPFDDKWWVFEAKWDGFRLITEKCGDALRLWSRNGIDVTTKYAVLLPALQKIEGSCVIDGELCALDAHGHSRFQLLQNALNKKASLLYVVFDRLFVGRKDIREKPLLERREILKALLPRDPIACRDGMRTQIPRQFGAVRNERDISVCIGLRGGPGRTSLIQCAQEVSKKWDSFRTLIHRIRPVSVSGQLHERLRAR